MGKPALVLDKDGVLANITSPVRRAFTKMAKEIGQPHVAEMIERLKRGRLAREVNKGQAMPYRKEKEWARKGLGAYAQIYAHLWALAEGGELDENLLRDFSTILPISIKELNQKLAEKYMEESNREPMLPEAKELFNNIRQSVFIISAAKGVSLWLREQLRDLYPSHDFLTLFVFQHVEDKVGKLLQLSHLLGEIAFITDTISDVKDALEANRKGANVRPVGVLTGLSSKEDFDKMGVPSYGNVLEAAKALGVI